MWQELLRSTGGLVRDWWNVDRIRISPRDGRLMRLRPPCIIRVSGQIVEVLRRAVGETSAGPYVTYECHNGDRPCLIRVTPVGPIHRPTVVWIEGDKEFEISESEVVFLG